MGNIISTDNWTLNTNTDLGKFIRDYALNDYAEIKKILSYIKLKNFYKIALYYHDGRDSSEIEKGSNSDIQKFDEIFSQYFSIYFWTSYYRNRSYISENFNYIVPNNSINIIRCLII